MSNRVVAYIVSSELIAASSQLPSNKNRSSTVHSLIHAFGLSHRVKVLRPIRASYKDLSAYHTREYLDAVLSPSGVLNESLGLDASCPPFPLLPSYVSLVAGAALTAAQALISNTAQIAICWDGGRHHAQKGEAAGYCYVADCILALLALKRAPPRVHGEKPRIMYIDLDLHFSDAVSQAFASTSQILTLSIHHTSPGFYPPSPLSALPVPTSPTFSPYTLSIPLHHGASSRTYTRLLPLLTRLTHTFSPSYIVLQCGVDALAGDPCSTANWDLTGLNTFVREVLGWGVPTMMLGGGGYHSANAARAWASLTALALGEEMEMGVETEIPEHGLVEEYAPSFTLDVPAGMMQDQNTEEYLKEVESCYDEVIRILQERMDLARSES